MKSRNIPSTYPYPDQGNGQISPTEYDALCSNWARRLPETTLRELASDYLRGIRDEITEDAYQEFKFRERAGQLSEQKSKGKSLKTPKKRAHHRSIK